jgi:hypothetical protein
MQPYLIHSINKKKIPYSNDNITIIYVKESFFFSLKNKYKPLNDDYVVRLIVAYRNGYYLNDAKM